MFNGYNSNTREQKNKEEDFWNDIFSRIKLSCESVDHKW